MTQKELKELLSLDTGWVANKCTSDTQRYIRVLRFKRILEMFEIDDCLEYISQDSPGFRCYMLDSRHWIYVFESIMPKGKLKRIKRKIIKYGL